MNLDEARAGVAQAARDLAAAGLVERSAGNVSARAGDLVAVTPSGAVLAELEPRDVAVVDLAGAIVDGSLAPTSEVGLHLGVYARLGAGAVVHTHPPFATAVACVLDELPCVHYELVALGDTIPVVPYATFGTPELASGVLGALEGRDAVLLANHGAVTVGADLGAAVDATGLLEWGCRVFWRARALGDPRALDAEERSVAADALRVRRNSNRPAGAGSTRA